MVDKFELAQEGKISSFFQVRNKVIPEGSVAHVIQRAPGRELLFVDDGDYLHFIHLLKEVSQKFNFKVFCFSLLPNHFHLLVKFLKNNASQAFKNLCERYAKYFNKKYERKGHVFYGAFRANLCFDESYLIAASLYIHLNPVKANLCEGHRFYRWSSVSLYTEKRNPETFIDYKFILRLFDKNIDDAKKIYSKLLEKSLNIKMGNVIEKKSALSLFRQRIVADIRDSLQNISSLAPHLLEDFTLEEEIKKLKSKKRLRDLRSKRTRRYVIEQLLSRGYHSCEIGARLGISYKTVERTIKEISST